MVSVVAASIGENENLSLGTGTGRRLGNVSFALHYGTSKSQPVSLLMSHENVNETNELSGLTLTQGSGRTDRRSPRRPVRSRAPSTLTPSRRRPASYCSETPTRPTAPPGGDAGSSRPETRRQRDSAPDPSPDATLVDAPPASTGAGVDFC